MSEKTLVYAPEVQVIVQPRQHPGEELDISSDVISGSVSRSIDSVSHGSIVLNNRRGRYTGGGYQIERMDRITVSLKKNSSWYRVLTGYVTKVPLVSLYPSTCTIDFQCSLKRLLNTYWDPGLPASLNLLKPDNDEVDKGAAGILQRLLVDVAGWSQPEILISEIPERLTKLATEYAEDYSQEELMEQVFKLLGVKGSVGSDQGTVTGSSADVDLFLKGLRERESNGNYTIKTSMANSDASGAYQYITTTWNNYKGYSEAYLAPPTVQDERARADALAAFGTYGDWQKVAAHHIYPAWADDKNKWNQNVPNNPLTMWDYVNAVCKYMASGGSSGDNKTSTTSGGTSSETLIWPCEGTPTVEVKFGAGKTGVVITSPSMSSDGVKAALSGKVTNVTDKQVIVQSYDSKMTYSGLTEVSVQKDQIVPQGTVLGKAERLTFKIWWNGKFLDPQDQVGKAYDVTTGDQTSGGGTTSQGASKNRVNELLFSHRFGNFRADALSLALKGDKAIVNDQPLFKSIKQFTAASLRSFMSGPNGEFVAFFPDPFGLYGTKAKLYLEDVEILDFGIDVSDDPITTHVFTFGSRTGDGSSISTGDLLGGNTISLENDFVRELVVKGSPLPGVSDEDWPSVFMKRFGKRPLRNDVPNVKSGPFEWFISLQTFMQKWSEQYNTRVRFTFMPELYPGMRVYVKSYGVQVYVQAVTHTFSYESGFSTSATINSPSVVGDSSIDGLTSGAD